MNVIATALLADTPKLVCTALNFFLNIDTMMADDDDEDGKAQTALSEVGTSADRGVNGAVFGCGPDFWSSASGLLAYTAVCVRVAVLLLGPVEDSISSLFRAGGMRCVPRADTFPCQKKDTHMPGISIPAHAVRCSRKGKGKGGHPRPANLVNAPFSEVHFFR